MPTSSLKIVDGVQPHRATSEDSEYRAFSFGRVGVRPQMTLLLRKASGEVEGFPYADFHGIHSMNEELGFSIQFGRRLVNIEGRNLKQLFGYVCNFRAAEIVEATEITAMALPEFEAIVCRVTWSKAV